MQFYEMCFSAYAKNARPGVWNRSRNKLIRIVCWLHFRVHEEQFSELWSASLWQRQPLTVHQHVSFEPGFFSMSL